MVKTIANLAEFNQIIHSEKKLVIVDFFATWCGPCQAFAPHFHQMEQVYNQSLFCQVDVDKAKDVAQHCGIRAMPTFQLFKNGQQVASVQGANKAKLEELIKAHGGAFSAFDGQGRSLGSVEGFKNPWADEREKDLQRRKKAEKSVQPQKTDEDAMIDEDLDDTALEALLLKKEKELKRGPTLLDKAREQYQAERQGKKSDMNPEEQLAILEKNVNQDFLKELLGMDFSKLRIIKALLETGNAGVPQAVDWLLQHQDDKDIDDPIEIQVETEEDRKRRIELETDAIKEQLKRNRKEREKKEKLKAYELERKRREEGLRMEKTRKEFEATQRRLEAEQIKKEKDELAREKKRVKKIAKMDKLTRKLNRLKREGADPFEIHAVESKLAKLKGVALPEKTISKPVKPSEPVSQSNTQSPKTNTSHSCRIRIRLFNGEMITAGFSPNDTVRKVHDHVLKFQREDFVLMTTIPRRYFQGSDLDKTLKESGLHPSGNLICSQV